MRVATIPSVVAVLLLVAGGAGVAGCVPRPASLATPAATAIVASPGPAGEPGTTGTTAPAGPTPIPSFARPTPLPAPTFLVYTVKAGDTLTSIARAFRTTPRSIAFWSRDEHPSLDPESAAYQPDRLEVGWILRLVPGSVFDEDGLMDATPSPSPDGSAGASPGETAGPPPGSSPNAGPSPAPG